MSSHNDFHTADNTDNTDNTELNSVSDKIPAANSHQVVIPERDAWHALFAIMIGFFMMLLDATVVAVATPQFQRELGASLNAVVWVTSVYLLTGAVPLLVTGRLGDRFGQRRMYLWGTTVFTLSSLACGLAPNIAWLIAARAVQGFGGAMVAPQVMAVVTRIFPREKQGAAMGVWGLVAGLASLTGPLLGGLIVGTVGWKWVFFINVPIGVISLIMVAKYLPALPKTAHKIDIPGVIISALAVFAIVYALQQGQAEHWPAWSWVLLAVGVGATGLFIAWQARVGKRGGEALVPLSLFRDRNFAVGCFSITAMGAAAGSWALPMMIYLQDARGMEAQWVGVFMMPMAIISGLLAPLAGRLSDRTHPRRLSMFGFGVSLLGYVLAIIAMRGDNSYWWLLPAICVMGMGNAFVWSPNSANTMRDVDRRMTGAASGIYNTTRQVGGVIGVAAVGAMMQWGESTTSVANAMGNSLIICAFALTCGFISVMFFQDRRTPLQIPEVAQP